MKMWFEHPTDLSETEPIIKLMDKYGSMGYGAYLLILEYVCEVGFNVQIDTNEISNRMQIDIDKFNEIFNYMLELNLFTLTDNNNLYVHNIKFHEEE